MQEDVWWTKIEKCNDHNGTEKGAFRSLGAYRRSIWKPALAHRASHVKKNRTINYVFCIWLAVYRKFCKFWVKFLYTVCNFVLSMWNFLPNNFFRFVILQKNWHTAPANWEIHRFFIAKTLYRKKVSKRFLFSLIKARY